MTERTEGMSFRTFSDSNLSKLYWQMRWENLHNPAGKINAVFAAAQLIRTIANNQNRPVRVLEAGCGEGHLLGTLRNICEDKVSVQEYVGVDNLEDVIERARCFYPTVRFLQRDYTADGILNLGRFSVIMLVNTLHEVFSSSYVPAVGEIDQPAGKRLVQIALANFSKLIQCGGYLVLFDGIEPSLDPESQIIIRFRHSHAVNEFRSFAEEYEAVPVTYEELGAHDRIKISVRDFTRYITKTIFLGNPVWQIERWESYQYYTETEFRENLANLGFVIERLAYLSQSHEHWQSRVVIETPGVDFPHEHVLIVAKRKSISRN